MNLLTTTTLTLLHFSIEDFQSLVAHHQIMLFVMEFPSEKILKDGDILNVDVTAYKDDWHGDTSRMFFVGEVSVKAKNLVKTTYDALIKTIKNFKI